jgi:hypothetical protein
VHNDTCPRRRGGERGAALIIALGMLTLLLVIALTFYRASRDDVRSADNAVNAVRAELVADGATAVAIAFINHDHVVHPGFTSLDTAWRTYFNGSWMAGKPWMWAPLEDPFDGTVHPMSPLRAGIPEVHLDRIGTVFPNGEFHGDDLYVPRLDFDTGNPLLPGQAPLDYSSIGGQPFVTTMDVADPTDTTFRRFSPIEDLVLTLSGIGWTNQADLDALTDTVYGRIAPNGYNISLSAADQAGVINRTLPAEQIHLWTDVDSDGDGLRDAVWLPVGADRYFPEDGLDNDLDGLTDEFDLDRRHRQRR